MMTATTLLFAIIVNITLSGNFWASRRLYCRADYRRQADCRYDFYMYIGYFISHHIYGRAPHSRCLMKMPASTMMNTLQPCRVPPPHIHSSGKEIAGALMMRMASKMRPSAPSHALAGRRAIHNTAIHAYDSPTTIHDVREAMPVPGSTRDGHQA